jgi:ribonuclease D
MSHVFIESLGEARGLREDLSSTGRLALDCEAAGFHRYSDRLCLVQVSVDGRTYVIDPLCFDPSELIGEALERPELQVVMHGADFDLRLLSRDLGIKVRGLVDTQISASLLGEEALGLASLLESRLGVKVSKKYQRADWAERPLTEGMLDYAASDTRHLVELADILARELADLGRTHWAEEECRALEGVADLAPDPVEPDDPVARVKGARNLSTRQVTALRTALAWRDEIARKRDRALFRVVGDAPLVEAVARHPRNVDELVAVPGFPRALAREEGAELIRRLAAVTAMSDDELTPYPKPARRGTGRPPPELEEAVERLKAVRNRKADELKLPRGTLLPNAVIVDVARSSPRSLEDLTAIDGMRAWKADVLGEALLEALRTGERG